MNKTILLGRLTRDPEVRYSQGDNATAIARFSLAVNRKFKNADGNYDADFPNCIAFGKQAEFIEKYFRKGDMIALTGRLQTGSYTNKDGVKVYTTDVVVEEVEFAGGKSNNGDTQNNIPKDTSFNNIPDDADDGEMPF